MRAMGNQGDRREREEEVSAQSERGQTMKHESRGRKKFKPTVSEFAVRGRRERLKWNLNLFICQQRKIVLRFV